MQPSEVNPDSSQPEEERPVRWLLGLVPYGGNWYRTVMALTTGTVLMGGAVKALMPEARTWPLEQFHIRAREGRFADTRLEQAEMGFPEFHSQRNSAAVRSLARPDGARLISESDSALPIRVLPASADVASLPESSPLRRNLLLPEESLPEPERDIPRRRVPPRNGGVPPLAGARGRSVTGGEEEGISASSSTLRQPIIGAKHEYQAQPEHQVVGSQVRTLGSQGTPGAQGASGQEGWGGGAGMPAQERLITGVRLVPERIDLEVGTSQAYDLQIQLDRGEWFSVTQWPETRFRLLTTNAGIEQHRQADNVLLSLLDTPERLYGSQVTFEGSLRIPGRSAPLTARATVRVQSPQSSTRR